MPTRRSCRRCSTCSFRARDSPSSTGASAGSGSKNRRTCCPGSARAERPEAVLLLIGYNNLTHAVRAGPLEHARVQRGDRFRRRRRARLHPPNQGIAGRREVHLREHADAARTGGRKRIDARAIVETNRQIRQRIARKRVTLVDTPPAVLRDTKPNTSRPTACTCCPPGYQAIADAFFCAIRATTSRKRPS